MQLKSFNQTLNIYIIIIFRVKCLVERGFMLELKRYTREEIAAIIGGSANRQPLKNKLDRYDVEYEIEGRANNCIFDIKAINDPFKLFCILELGIGAQSDFDRMKYFYYYYFCDDNFVRLTAEQKQEYMEDESKYVSRQTIRTWEGYLERKGWISLHGENYRYYFSKAGNHRDATKEEYSEAWKYYWKRRDEGEVSWIIMMEITSKYGGAPRKHYIPEHNAFYLDDINRFTQLIINSIEGEIETNS